VKRRVLWLLDCWFGGWSIYRDRRDCEWEPVNGEGGCSGFGQPSYWRPKC